MRPPWTVTGSVMRINVTTSVASVVPRPARMHGAAPAGAAGVDDLPLVEMPATQRRQWRNPRGSCCSCQVMAAGRHWTRRSPRASSQSGMSVIGLNSRKYFWTARTPDGTTRDVERILRHYLQAWHKTEIALAGYSFGADVMPVIVNRLPADLKAQDREHLTDRPGSRRDLGSPCAGLGARHWRQWVIPSTRSWRACRRFPCCASMEPGKTPCAPPLARVAPLSARSEKDTISVATMMRSPTGYLSSRAPQPP